MTAAREIVRIEAGLEPLVPGLLESRRAMAVEIFDALAAGALDAARAVAHKAGGGLRMYGFERAAALAAGVEAAAAAGDPVGAGARAAEFAAHLDAIEVEYIPGEEP